MTGWWLVLAGRQAVPGGQDQKIVKVMECHTYISLTQDPHHGVCQCREEFGGRAETKRQCLIDVY